MKVVLHYNNVFDIVYSNLQLDHIMFIYSFCRFIAAHIFSCYLATQQHS